MSSVADVKALLSEALMKAGEAWGALDTAREQIGGALEAALASQSAAAMAFDGSDAEEAGVAVQATLQASLELRGIIGGIDTAQTWLVGTQQACEQYIGRA